MHAHRHTLDTERGLALAISLNLSLTMQHDLAHAGQLFPPVTAGIGVLIVNSLLHITSDLYVQCRHFKVLSFIANIDTHKDLWGPQHLPAVSYPVNPTKQTDRSACCVLSRFRSGAKKETCL